MYTVFGTCQSVLIGVSFSHSKGGFVLQTEETATVYSSIALNFVCSLFFPDISLLNQDLTFVQGTAELEQCIDDIMVLVDNIFQPIRQLTVFRVTVQAGSTPPFDMTIGDILSDDATGK